MGQYYTPLLIDSNGNETTLSAHAFNNGMKLMEHSYIGNNLVNIALSLINGNPYTVAWIGDYADDDFDYCTDRTRENLGKHYTSAWKRDQTDEEYQADKDKQVQLYSGEREEFIKEDTENKGFLINRTKMVYIDLSSYYLQNRWEEEYKGEKYFMCINPLPLLTACGNGLGGGDYLGTMQDAIGSWAFDEIMFSFDKPDDLAEVKFEFKKKRYAA